MFSPPFPDQQYTPGSVMDLPPTEFGEACAEVTDPNRLSPELGVTVQDLEQKIGSLETGSNPYLKALQVQTANHLQHISFTYHIAEDSPDYTHDYVIDGAYPYRPTKLAIAKAREVLSSFEDSDMEALPYLEADEVFEKQLVADQREITRQIGETPLEHYQEFRSRLKSDGMNASFPEFASTVDYLKLRLLTSADTQKACAAAPQLERLRTSAYQSLEALSQNGENTLPYTSTVLGIECALEFFDIVARGLTPDSAPELYHSGRYEYYAHYLLAEPDHIIFPTTSPLGATDLIKVRGIPLGFVGVNTQTEYVDGFPQTPYEFFHHDMNHSRRMFQFFTETATAMGVDVETFAATSTKFIFETLLPLFIPDAEDTTDTKKQKSALKMLLFEILHEDALAAHPATIEEAIARPPLKRTPFERIEDGKVIYVMEPGATTLAYVFRKLGHTFYDTPENRSEGLGDMEARSRWTIVQAALELYQTVAPDLSDTENLIKSFEQLVATDEGFPDAFFNEVVADINKRVADSDRDFLFLISNPESAPAAIARIRKLGKKVHSLFGYSDLGYADEEAMLASVKENLLTLDPEETIVSIGATPGGIGKAYEVAKSLGFQTLGIVSSKSIAHGGHYSPYVDQVFVVKDTEWGGYIPGQESEVTPTTQVFIEASDSIAAFGGGIITAVTLAEANKVNKPLTFVPSRMNATDHSHGADGPAFEAWQKIVA